MMFVVLIWRVVLVLIFKLLKEWNKSAMSKHLRDMSQKADTLWVKWIHTYVIKRENLWFMSTPVSSSWTIKKILRCGDRICAALQLRTTSIHVKNRDKR